MNDLEKTLPKLLSIFKIVEQNIILKRKVIQMINNENLKKETNSKTYRWVKQKTRNLPSPNLVFIL
jgi:hypothetical protein